MQITRKPIMTEDPLLPQKENPGWHLVSMPDTPMSRHWIATYSASPGVPADTKLYFVQRGGNAFVAVFVTRDAPWVVAFHKWLGGRGIQAMAMLPGHGERDGITLAVNK
jgi:hypothetical protein